MLDFIDTGVLRIKLRFKHECTIHGQVPRKVFVAKSDIEIAVMPPHVPRGEVLVHPLVVFSRRQIVLCLLDN